MKQNSKLRENEQQQTTHEQNIQQTTMEKDFSSVDELLRYDAAQTSVSRDVADKLARSIAGEPETSSSWWRRLVTTFKAK
jgi:hypothetical protein